MRGRWQAGWATPGSIPRRTAYALPPSPGIILGFPTQNKIIMEAEQLNAIANKIADLNTRSAELRRYL